MRVVWSGILCIALGCVLGGCSIALDGNSGVFSAAPGKYDFLDCPSLATYTRSSTAREKELTNLIERASRDPLGPVIGTLVYQDELNQVRSNLLALRKTSDEKRCMPDIVKPTAASLAPVH